MTSFFSRKAKQKDSVGSGFVVLWFCGFVVLLVVKGAIFNGKLMAMRFFWDWCSSCCTINLCMYGAGAPHHPEHLAFRIVHESQTKGFVKERQAKYLIYTAIIVFYTLQSPLEGVWGRIKGAIIN